MSGCSPRLTRSVNSSATCPTRTSIDILAGVTTLFMSGSDNRGHFARLLARRERVRVRLRLGRRLRARLGLRVRPEDRAMVLILLLIFLLILFLILVLLL